MLRSILVGSAIPPGPDEVAARHRAFRRSIVEIDEAFDRSRRERERLLRPLEARRRAGWHARVLAAFDIAVGRDPGASRILTSPAGPFADLLCAWSLTASPAPAARSGGGIVRAGTPDAAMMVVIDDAPGAPRLLVTIRDADRLGQPPVLLLCRDADAAATREFDPEIIRDAGTIRLRYEVPVERGDYHIVIGHPRETENGRE